MYGPSTPTRRLGIAVAAACAGLAAACVSPSKAPDPSAEGRVEAMLRPYPGRDELSEFVGGPPERCVKGSLDNELCQWSAGNQLVGWQPMARAIATRDRVNLVCVLPSSGAPRAPGSCSVHPRRSNRYSWEIPKGGNARSRAENESATQARLRHQQTANAWMEQARTLPELSRLMGAIPETCTLTPDGAEQTCLWRTNDQTFGHGTLVAWLDVARSRKIRLRCMLPSDGSPRAPSSCYAEVGD